MKLYFSTEKKRLAIDTTTKTYSVNYFRLGGWKDYIKISSMDRHKIIVEIMAEDYTENDENF